MWTFAGGVPRALGATNGGKMPAAPANALTFVQMSDTHIGFRKEANPDIVGGPCGTRWPTSTRCRRRLRSWCIRAT